MFRRKGIYIALLVLSTLVLVSVLIFNFMFLGPQPSFTGMSEEMVGMEPGIAVPDKPLMTEAGEAQPSDRMPVDFPGAQRISEYGLPASDAFIIAVAIICAVVFLFSIFMLCRIAKKKSQHTLTEENGLLDEEPSPRKKSQLGNVVIMLLAAAILIISLLPEGGTDSSGFRAREQVIEVEAEPGSIDVELRSGGAIAENTAVMMSLAGDIRIEQWLVNNGDYVEKDSPIALADKDSVILAIAELTELMAKLDGDINESFSDTISNAVYAPASGRVKAVHAQIGADVVDTVGEYGCLIRLSLDGLMALDIEATDSIDKGMTVAVEKADGSFIGGIVEKTADGSATVIVSDEQAAYGEQVSVYNLTGNFLGQGSLYIHKEIGITGLAGTVERINVTENMLVGTDMALLVLGNTSFSGERDVLTALRRQMEDELTGLFSVYNSGLIHAPCNGRIAAVNEQLLAEGISSGHIFVNAALLSSNEPTMKSYAVSVESVDKDTGTITVIYTDSEASRTEQISVSTVMVFKYAKGSYQPCTAADISSGDSLILGMYVDESGKENIDHIILYPAQSGGQGGNSGTSQSGGQSGSGTGSPGSSSGSKGSTSGSTGIAAAAGAAAAETEEDPYLYSETILAYITPFDKAEIGISIDEADISAYYIGQTLQLSFDALPAQSFTGTVSKIDPNGSNEDGGSTKFSVSISVDRSKDMLTGMNASLVAHVDTVRAELVIPLAAVNEENGDIFVYTSYDKENDILTGAVSVKTGVSDTDMVEIKSGLAKGQKVYYRYADSMEYTRQ